MGNTDDNKFDNFADIAGNYNILVPIIQRDYVQGSEVHKVNRDSFIRKILKSLETGKELDMQYIYGVLKGEDVFLPIDGQQRLTTSYLISWFCAVREGRFEDFLKNTKSFSYQVRTSSTDFFSELRNPNNLDEFEEYVDGKKDNLKNSKWYKRKWRPDNTINNAISMLDAVRKICDEEIGDKYLFDTIFPDQEKKTQGKRCPLKFIMIIQNKPIVSDGEKSDLDDNMFETENRAAVTYINMNSRGKQLTEFESLKNKLHRLSEDGKKFAEDYDSEYIDVFKQLVQRSISKADERRIKELDGLVNEMDSYAEKLLRLLFFDLKSLQNEKEIKAKDVSVFREILDKNDENELPEYYFDIIKYVMSTKVIDDENIQIFLIDYIRGGSAVRTWNFFRYIWAGFKRIDTNEWNRFIEHSGIEQFDDHRKIILVQNIYKIINVIADVYNGSTMSYICKTDIDKLYESFSRYCDRAVLKEEQILAYMYLNERAKYKEIENIEYRLRHLFYICGYWDDPSDKTGEKWKLLKEYKEYEILHRNGDEESLYLWKKLYYLKSLKNDGQYMLPEKTIDTSWSANSLEWNEAGFGSAKLVLERTKICYEELSGMMKETGSNSLKEQLNKYIDELVGTLRKDEWLYYVLTNNIDDLFENRVVQEKSVYRYADAASHINANYFLYVFTRKSGNMVCNEGKLSLDKAPGNSGIIWDIEKPEGYTNNKRLSIYFHMNISVLPKMGDRTEIMWDGKNHVIRAEILNEDGQNGVEIRTVTDDSTYENIKKDINIIYEELVKWLQQQKTVNLQLLQDLAFGRDDKYTAAAGEIEKKVNEIISKSNLNYGYKVKENCFHKNYNDLHIEICLADQQGDEYSPFFASNNHIEQFYLHTK